MTTNRNSGFIERLRRGPVLFDGGLGTMMIENGLEPGAPPEEWNRSRPDVVRNVHAAYIDAGADVVTTNSFGATPARLERYGLGDALAELNNVAVGLANDAVARRELAEGNKSRPRFVAFSVGPTGKMLPPVGQADESEIEADFTAQIDSLDEPVDLVIGETFFDVREAMIALGVLKQAVDVAVGMSMTFNKTPRGFFTVRGDPLAESVLRLEAQGADFIAVNCSIASEDMLDLAKVLRAKTELPVLCQPNAGSPMVVDGKPTYAQRPEEFAADIAGMIEVGVDAVGGCCGTTPDFIRRASEMMSRL
jgi:methionine synthase I (cobalamin-dependent)